MRRSLWQTFNLEYLGPDLGDRGWLIFLPNITLPALMRSHLSLISLPSVMEVAHLRNHLSTVSRALPSAGSPTGSSSVVGKGVDLAVTRETFG